MQGHISSVRRARPGRLGALLTGALAVLVLVAGCGGQQHREGTKISWQPGTAPAVAAVAKPTVVGTRPAARPQGTTVAAAPANVGNSPPLTPAQLAQYKPNELGKIPILEYHQIVTDPKKEAEFVRTAAHFQQDLEWLYEHNFYVVPLRDILLNQIAAPPGKHPVALTFDDSTTGQFRYIKGSDGTLTIDPNSAVGVMEAMFAKHPDFGRGGIFFTLPNNCFDWDGDGSQPDQTPYCKQKLEWLLAHGYEIGDHTLDHADILNVDDATFKKEVGGGIVALKQIVPNATIDILALPFGNYPDKDKHPEQREWLKDGFEYDGTQIKLLGLMEVGAEPAASPASADWDPEAIPRIQAFNQNVFNEWGGLDTWFPEMANGSDWLYTSDGNAQTITIPNNPSAQLPALSQIQVGSKKVIRYGG